MADPRQRASDGGSVNIDCISLSEAVVTYLRLKGSGKGITFRRAAERACGYVIDTCGDKPLSSYTKADANAFRDALIARGMAGSSITRVFGTVRSIINFAANEEGIELTNPFGKVYYDRYAGVSDRQPIPVEAIRAVQAECYRLDDDMRWLVALVADTGMRLAEAAGLLCEDIVHDNEGNYIARITPHPWRRLKTAGSMREVPLVGSARWAAERLMAVHGGSGFAFPRYNKTDTTNANAASAGLNKWLKAYVPAGATMHSFRHSMRDRLRAVECPADIVDQIGGWQTNGIGHGYGKGYAAQITIKWMEKAIFL
ncbi:integrase [Limimaricola variabilis]|uniref:Integrase n=1 Tax=Limimaricola variabilis TaxID=1492771 RepID=A0ABR6HT11_9RHOB|nr:integrase [Limimaricola variabilis]